MYSGQNLVETDFKSSKLVCNGENNTQDIINSILIPANQFDDSQDLSRGGILIAGRYRLGDPHD
jgi:hypothetical protein